MKAVNEIALPESILYAYPTNPPGPRSQMGLLGSDSRGIELHLSTPGPQVFSLSS